MGRLLSGLTLIALAVVAAGVWLLPTERLGPSPPGTGRSAVAPVPASGLEPPGLSELADLTERPPFAASRRAPGAAGQDESLVLGRYRLAGVIVAPTRRSVILSAASGPLTVSEGEVVDGWTVEEITPERVILVSGGRRQEISVADPTR